MMPVEPVRPLQDVWLRPRRVFRELATQPVGAVDYLLGAAQGVVFWFALSREQSAGATMSIAAIFVKSLIWGSIGGLILLFAMAAIYVRLGVKRPSAHHQVFHVLAYSGVPLAASLAIWTVVALVVGEPAFIATPRPDLETFLAFLLHAQAAAYVLLAIWSWIIQIMGLSEIQGLTTGKAFGIWVIGQLIVALAFLSVLVFITLLFPGP